MNRLTKLKCPLGFLLLLPLLAMLATGSVSAQEEPPAEAVAEVQPEAAPSAAESKTPAFAERLNGLLDRSVGRFNSQVIDRTIFLPVPIPGTSVPGDPEKKQAIPLVLILLIVAAVFFTLRFGLINVRAFKHAIDVIRGKFDDPNDEGDISHFRALTSALSATVGLGNIAGVAIAISLGGPGAVLWMTLGGLFGMASKFTECTLAQIYRTKNPDGTVNGGPMYYLHHGLRDLHPALAPVGKVFAVAFAFLVMFGAFGAGNMFQANQSFEALQSAFPAMADYAWGFGIMMMVLVGVVMLGGITRIGATTARIVPIMAGIYVVAALVIIIGNIGELPAAVGAIFSGAFSGEAAFGGVVGTLIQGVKRSAFSNEAGLGSAAIAHSAAKTDEPVREGIVALLEPFIDTVLICNMTALVIIITGAYLPSEATAEIAGNGVAITQYAFSTVIPWFPYILSACVILFAYSTMISWGYYGERGWIYLLDHFGKGTGLKTLVGFRVLFIAFVYIGTVIDLESVINFSDGMVFSMAFPNLIGCLLLSGLVAAKLNDYWGRYKSGEMKPYELRDVSAEGSGSGI